MHQKYCLSTEMKTELSVLQINIKKNFKYGFEVLAKNIMLEEIMSSYNNDYKKMKLDHVKFSCQINNDGQFGYGIKTKTYYEVFFVS